MPLLPLLQCSRQYTQSHGDRTLGQLGAYHPYVLIEGGHHNLLKGGAHGPTDL